MKFVLYGVLMFVLIGCKKQSETLELVSIKDVYPLAVGKTYLYRMDSTVSINFGKTLETHSYQAKDSIESTFTDALGNTAFRIFRYTRDTLGTTPWVFCATYQATFTSTNAEYIDNNLRYIKLAGPISYNTTWKGNAHINTTQGSSVYDYLDNWDYTYQDLGESFTCLKGAIPDTYTVLQQNQTTPSVFDASVRNDKNYSIEVYAKGIGLIYKDFLHYVWQPTPSPKFQDESYGVKLNLIDYK